MDFSFIAKAGYVMIPLLLLSVVAATLVLERFFFFHRMDSFREEDFRHVQALIRSRNKKEASDYCRKFKTLISDSIQFLLARQDATKDELDHFAQMEYMKQTRMVNMYLNIIRVIPNIATLLGLLGTVTGMIKNFIAVVQVGTGDPTVMASGISEALINTATGLIIAIPVMFLYTLVLNRAEALEQRLFIYLSETAKSLE